MTCEFVALGVVAALIMVVFREPTIEPPPLDPEEGP